MKKIISIISILTMVLGLGSVALADKESEIITKEPIVIAAEDIGIKTFAIGDDFVDEDFDEEIKEEFNEEFEDDNSDVEDEIVDEPVQDTEEETESPAPPEGKVEGYVAGVYFEPNCYDCEICEECYKCEDDGHIYAHSVYMDDSGYVLEEWCTICGHGTSKKITDEEFEMLGVECDVEF